MKITQQQLDASVIDRISRIFDESQLESICDRLQNSGYAEFTTQEIQIAFGRWFESLADDIADDIESWIADRMKRKFEKYLPYNRLLNEVYAENAVPADWHPDFDAIAAEEEQRAA